MHQEPAEQRQQNPPKMRQTDQKIFFTVYNKYFMKPFFYSDFLVQKHSEFPIQVEELPEIDNWTQKQFVKEIKRNISGQVIFDVIWSWSENFIFSASSGPISNIKISKWGRIWFPIHLHTT